MSFFLKNSIKEIVTINHLTTTFKKEKNMAIQTLKTIKSWFRTGLKPTQDQFWDTWDSFRHKDEKIPLKDVEDIDNLFTPFEIKGIYNTNGDALAGGLAVGEYYRKPISNNLQASTLAVVVEILPSIRLSFEDIDNTMTFLGISNKESITDWNTYLAPKNLTVKNVRIEGNDAILELRSNSIDYLNLNNMQLINIEITGLNRIISLELYNNKLSYIPESILTIPYLQSLGLGYNKFTDLSNAIPLPSSLYYLDLSQNEIVNFEPLEGILSNISYLFLNNNPIVVFNPEFLPSTLTYLGLQSCSIQEFNPNPGRLPFGLQTISLSNNFQTNFNPDFGVLPSSVQNLYLGNNPITVFDPSFALPESLRVIQLLQTSITFFDPSIALPGGLTELWLGYTPLNTFDPSIALPSGLTYLHIAGTSITKFNPTIALPSTLNYIDIQWSQINTETWNTETDWITNVANNGQFKASGQESIKNTTTESLLLAKGWIVEA